jgi:oligoendopeptidase F
LWWAGDFLCSFLIRLTLLISNYPAVQSNTVITIAISGYTIRNDLKFFERIKTLMLAALPTHYEAAENWTWADIEPYFTDLQNRDLTPATIDQWLKDWSAISDVISEVFSRARVATTQDTSDEEAESYLKHLLATIYPPIQQANNALDQKLLASGIVPPNMELPIKRSQTDVEIFREENIALSTREQVLGMEFNKIIGAMSVQWKRCRYDSARSSKIADGTGSRHAGKSMAAQYGALSERPRTDQYYLGAVV